MHGGADALGLTQSAVTKRLQALERRTDVTLLQRGRFGVRPTAAGRLLYPEAKQALAALARAQDVLVAQHDVADRALALAASHTVGEFLLPGWLNAFRSSEQPDMLAQVEIINSPGVLRAVSEREVQIGFVEGLDTLDGYDVVTVWKDSLVVVVAADHRWARRRSISSRELADESYVAREAGSGTRAVVDDALSRAGVDLVATLETASLQSVKRSLIAGGFSVMSPLAIEAERRAGQLMALVVRDVTLDRELRAVHDGQLRLTGLARRFWSWLNVSPLTQQ